MKIFSGYGHYHAKEKQRLLAWFSGLDPAIKRKVIMRINFIAFFVFMSMLNVSATTFAQSITATFRNVPLKQVLTEINKQSGYELIYNNKHFIGTHNVTVSIKDKSLIQALDMCFQNQPVSYVIIDKTIVLKPKAIGIKDKIIGLFKKLTITGKVVDEDGKPLPGVNVRVKGTDVKTATNEQGSFIIDVQDIGAVLQFSFVGYQFLEHTIADVSPISIKLEQEPAQLEEVGIVSTGYQLIPKERATGSFIQLNNSQINRSVSTNLMERLNGMVTGLTYSDITSSTVSNTSPLARMVGIQIRGTSTLSPLVSVSPLIVLDNFPYEGDIKNINPNDIESITVLKDAAAASIWGARSGNGVIVITTKKGTNNSPISVDINSNVTFRNKPNLHYDRNFLASNGYIEAETALFNAGYFDAALSDNVSYTPVSPVVELLNRIRSSNDKIEIARLNEQINVYKQIDVRDDYKRHVYQNSIIQQYSVGLRGGTSKMNYSLSAGFDKNPDNIVRNGFDRITVNTTNSYRLLDRLEVTVGIMYTRSNTQLGNNSLAYTAGIPVGGSYSTLYPYASFAGENGEHLAIIKDFRPEYIQQTKTNGFMDWQFRPLDELELSQQSTSIQDLILKAGINYKVLPFLKAEVLFQNERQTIRNRQLQNLGSYYTRNLINQFSVFAENGAFNYQVPNNGGILKLGTYDWNSNNLRGQLSFDKRIRKIHEVTAILGGEVRQLRTSGFDRTSYGYSEQFGTSSNNLNFSDFLPVNPIGASMIPAPEGAMSGVLNRFISYYANLGYTYDNRYTFTASGRRDGTNLFGVKTNDKIVPLWSTGLGWSISNESFYNSSFLPYLKFRATYGFNGNVYYGSAYVTGIYLNNSTTGLPNITSLTAPNPRLRWEKVRNINIGLDFEFKSSVITGTIEYYRKNGQDLIEPVALALSTGFTTYRGNAASTMTQGVDLTLRSQNLKGMIKWGTTLQLSTLHDKLTKYDVKQSSSSISDIFYGEVGRPLYSVFGYRWAGLDPETGDPQGLLNDKVSKDYRTIFSSFAPGQLNYHGSAVPTLFGNLRNDFAYKNVGVSVGISYKLGYFFRRQSTGLSYSDVLTNNTNSDFNFRWRQKGDELNTDIPSATIQENRDRTRFYQYSDALIEKGNHIRLQDIRLFYDLSLKYKSPFKAIQIYCYANNIGIIWRANKFGIDPDVPTYTGSHDLPIPFSISFGLKVTL